MDVLAQHARKSRGTMMVSGFHVNKKRVRIFPWAFGSHNKAIAIVSTYIDKKRE